MATQTTTTAAKKPAAKKSTAKTTTAKRSTAKKTTASSTARQEAAKKAAATRKRNQEAAARKRQEAAEKAAETRKRNEAAAEREKVAPARSRLTEREARTLAEDASYAAAGLAIDAVTLVRSATAKLEELRADVQRAAADPATTVRGVAEVAPTTLTRTVDDVRGRLVTELETAIEAFERTFDAKATEGRKLAEAMRSDERVAKLLEQSSNTRSQVKAALTSVTRTFDVMVGAGRKQAGNAVSQVKAATTSLRRSADAVPAAADAAEDEIAAAS